MPSLNKKTSLKLLRLLKPYQAQMGVALAALVGAVTATIGLGIGLRHLIDKGFVLQDKQTLNQALIGMFCFVGLLAGVSYLRATVSSWVGEQLAMDLRKRLFAHLLEFEPNFFDKNPAGDLVSRIQADTAVIRILFGSSLTTGLRSLLQFMAALGMLFWSSWQLALLTCLIIPVAVIPIYVFGRRVKRCTGHEHDLQARLSAFFEEKLLAATTLQAFHGVASARNFFDTCADRCLKTAAKRSRAKGHLSSMVIAVVFSAVCLVLWGGSHQVLAGDLSGGELTAFVFYAVLSAGSVNSLSEVMSQWNQAVGASQRMFDLLDQQPAISSPPHPKSLPASFESEICFSGVSFRYPTRPEDALHSLSFSVRKGETVAFVGPSGSGKTTLFKLLQRFYDPDAGTITIEGVDLKQTALQALRHKIAWVPQDPFIFSGTIRENLCIGHVGVTDDRLIDVCQKASIYDFVNELPDGFNTLLGDKGIRLSGGQRQRLAIARAILKNADILLLDEATNALDAENENSVNRALTHLMKDRTTLVVAHRLFTVLGADRIVVLNHGRLVTQGSHRFLLETCDLYRRYADLQFRSVDVSSAEKAPGTHKTLHS